MKTTKVLFLFFAAVTLLATACAPQQPNEIIVQQTSPQPTQQEQAVVDKFSQDFQAKLVDAGVPTDIAQTLSNAGLTQTQTQTGMNQILPENLLSTSAPFLSGVLGGIGGLNLNGTGMDQANLLQTVLSSFTGTTLQNSSGLPTSSLAQLFTNIGGTQMHILPVLTQGGLPSTDIMQILGSGFMGGLGNGGGGLGSTQLQTILSSFTGGVAGTLPSIVGSNGNIGSLLQNFNFGIGNQLPIVAGSQGLDMSQISKWISGGQATGLANNALPTNTLSSLLSMIQMGNLNGVLASEGGVTSNQLSSILQGGAAGSLTGIINGGGNVNQLADITRLFSQNTMSSLPGLGVNSNILNMLVSGFSQGAVGGVGNMQGTPDIFSMLLGQINTGSQQGLMQGGVQGNMLTMLMSLIGGITQR